MNLPNFQPYKPKQKTNFIQTVQDM